MKNEGYKNLILGLIQLLVGLTGLLVMVPVWVSIYFSMTATYPFLSTMLLGCLGAFLLLSSSNPRNASLKFIHQAIHWNNLVEMEGEESRMLEQREKETIENRSMDFWR